MFFWGVVFWKPSKVGKNYAYLNSNLITQARSAYELGEHLSALCGYARNYTLISKNGMKS